jgi:peptide/nickel transport system substrate-binding protein
MFAVIAETPQHTYQVLTKRSLRLRRMADRLIWPPNLWMEALSLGIDRDQINDIFYLGTSTPSATMVADDSPYFPGPEWRVKWASHDPAQANAPLDKIGLTHKDADGYRLRRDGEGRIHLELHSATSFVDFPAIGDLVKRHWQAIGIDLNVQLVEPDLLVRQAVANELMVSAHQVGTDDPFLRPDTLLPVVTNNYRA